MEALAFVFGLALAMALSFLIWLYSKPGKNWLESMH